MATVNMLAAKSSLSKLVQAVEAGDTPEVVIARKGVPAARRVPIVPAPAGQRIGVARGAFDVPDNIDASNAEVAERFFGTALR
jgi:antitoxin (DNA-binding transcriptional repressor) of toxin-antitoxin stability system